MTEHECEECARAHAALTKAGVAETELNDWGGYDDLDVPQRIDDLAGGYDRMKKLEASAHAALDRAGAAKEKDLGIDVTCFDDECPRHTSPMSVVERIDNLRRWIGTLNVQMEIYRSVDWDFEFSMRGRSPNFSHKCTIKHKLKPIRCESGWHTEFCEAYKNAKASMIELQEATK
jgi:hypothetical protein